jgi:Co/Zn/Cd efflux system component
MDCPSEEQLIRMKLEEVRDIVHMDFDISNRQLIIYHEGDYKNIFKRLESLNLDTSIVESIPAEDVSNVADNLIYERKLLWQVLGINFFFFVLEIFTGFISNSMGLVADSFDMLADSIVYSLALFAVGKVAALKKSIAKSAGYFQLILGLMGVVEVLRRFFGLSEVPVFQTMIIISILALIANSLSLYLLQKSKSKDAHMQASMIFTSNDVIANLGVIVAGVLVYFTNSKYPDLIVGLIVFSIVLRGAFKIIELSK